MFTVLAVIIGKFANTVRKLKVFTELGLSFQMFLMRNMMMTVGFKITAVSTVVQLVTGGQLPKLLFFERTRLRTKPSTIRKPP